MCVFDRVLRLCAVALLQPASPDSPSAPQWYLNLAPTPLSQSMVQGCMAFVAAASALLHTEGERIFEQLLHLYFENLDAAVKDEAGASNPSSAPSTSLALVTQSQATEPTVDKVRACLKDTVPAGLSSGSVLALVVQRRL